MPVLEAGVYEPDLTLVAAYKTDGRNIENNGLKCKIGNAAVISLRSTASNFNERDITNGNTIEFSDTGAGYTTIDIFFNQSCQTRLGAHGGTSTSNTDNRGWQIAPRVGFNKHLLNKPTRSFQISGHAANVFGLDQANQSTYGLEHLDTSLLTNTQNMFVEFPYNGGLIEGNPRKQYINISTWDVSNVTCMKDMFMGIDSSRQLMPAQNNALEMGDLRGWCVQHVTSKPTNWNSELTEFDPCWGECPLPGEIGTCDGSGDGGIDDKPMPEGGNWLNEDQQYYISIDENAGRYDQYFIDFGTSCQLWRADRGTQNWSKRSNASYINLDKSYDWIVTSRYSNDRITFQTYDGPFEFLGADTANVTNMSNMFKDSQYFNDDIGWWDTSNVRNMRNMFAYAENFNQDLSGWDVSNVTCSYHFDRGVSGWDPSYKPQF